MTTVSQILRVFPDNYKSFEYFKNNMPCILFCTFIPPYPEGSFKYLTNLAIDRRWVFWQRRTRSACLWRGPAWGRSGRTPAWTRWGRLPLEPGTQSWSPAPGSLCPPRRGRSGARTWPAQRARAVWGREVGEVGSVAGQQGAPRRWGAGMNEFQNYY